MSLTSAGFFFMLCLFADHGDITGAKNMNTQSVVQPTTIIIPSLSRLNHLRAKANLAPLKAWKENKAKLAAAIAKLEAAHPIVVKKLPAGIAEGAFPTKARTPSLPKPINVAGKSVAQIEAIRAKAAKKTSKAERGPGRPRDEELAAYVKAQGYTGKKARIAFRKAGLHGPYTLNAQTKAALKK